MNEKDITSNSTKAIYTDIISQEEALNSLKLTKRKGEKFYKLEANYRNHIVKGIVELDEFTFKQEPFTEDFAIYKPRASGFIKFNFVPKTNTLFKVITKRKHRG